ncbi:aryl-sulfate sulfotransferase [candidate division WOR-3 bacterium]|nr:aryl-sulfate sulfotransferase [candidate division WOR-3 bacterium]
MDRRTFLVVVVILLASISTYAQERTVGMIVNKEGSFEGYTLFAPNVFQGTTYLINNEGLLIHSWKSHFTPGLSVYLSADGYLYRSITVGASEWFEEYGGGVEKYDWDGNVVWHYEYSSNDYRQHHDIEIMPNGNVLMIAWEYIGFTEAVEAGRDSTTLNEDGLWPDHIIEVEPTSDSGGTIVWEWHVWDHLIQDFDSTKENYGVVSDNPGLIDLNYVKYPGITDWIHLNSVRYNETLDQVIISSRHFDEIWVIDHSTTTEEARGHTGGKYVKGGDILYRWGNPRSYRQGTRDDQQFFSQHDAQWIDEGLAGAGHILVFNNGSAFLERYYTSVDEIQPPVDEFGNYSFSGPIYGPEEPCWTYTKPEFFSKIFSGAQRLPNGNTLMCEGSIGTFFEVTPSDEEVWRYVNPVTPFGIVYQGDTIPPALNHVFKIRRYPPDFPAFEGRDLTPGDPIELYHAIEENDPQTWVDLEFYPNPFTQSVNVVYQLGKSEHVEINVYNSLGQEVKTLINETKQTGKYETHWDGTDNHMRQLSSGVYFCRLQSGNFSETRRVVLCR